MTELVSKEPEGEPVAVAPGDDAMLTLVVLEPAYGHAAVHRTGEAAGDSRPGGRRVQLRVVDLNEQPPPRCRWVFTHIGLVVEDPRRDGPGSYACSASIAASPDPPAAAGSIGSSAAERDGRGRDGSCPEEFLRRIPRTLLTYLRRAWEGARMRRGLVTGVIVGALVGPSAAVAQMSTDPVFHAKAQELYLRSQQRGIDQATNPDYLKRVAPFAEEMITTPREKPVRPHDVDPYRLNWGCRQEPQNCLPRGEEHDFEIPNRYGARMHGHLSLPLDRGDDPLPAVIMLTGGFGTEHGYRGLAQGLAEAGYVVLGMSVQGDYGAQESAPDPVPGTAENEYCRPHDHDGWQQPAEMGITENGECAGKEPAGDEPDTTLGIAALITTHGADREWLTSYYEAVKARKTFGALDAVEWLLSKSNPHRRLVDPERIGIMGHSLGAHGALLAGNGDPKRRFRAVVALDGYGLLRPTTSPRVPTMFQHADGQDSGPHSQPPGPLPGHTDAERFRDARVATMVVTLGGSTHQEFNYVPFPLQQAPLFLNASRDGERVSLHYALAWFDRWLGDGQTRKQATARLLADTYDDRVDRSSVGQGPYDAATRQVLPPKIGGESTRYHLSPLYPSWAAFGNVECADLRAGCR